MASTSVCTTCRLVLRQQLRQLRTSQGPVQSIIVSTRPNVFRLFSTTKFVSAAQPASKPVEATIGDIPQPGQSIPDTATQSIAKELRKRASSVTETYVAYGVCENLVKECARQADYTIPQAHEKDVPVPKTKDGEDLGVGKGWWYEGKCSRMKPPRFNKPMVNM